MTEIAEPPSTSSLLPTAVAVIMQKIVITSRTISASQQKGIYHLPSIIYPQVNFNFRFWVIFYWCIWLLMLRRPRILCAHTRMRAAATHDKCCLDGS